MDLRQLLEARSARALDEDEDGIVLVSSDLPGTFQLYELAGELRQLTAFDEPVSGAFLPATRYVIAQMDSGGNERHQLYLFDRDAPPGDRREALEDLTRSPDHVHRLLGARSDGKEIAFSSNRRNGIDFDIYVLDLQSRETRIVYDGGGWVQEASGYSPTGRYLSFLRPGPRPLDSDLCLVDFDSGEILVPLPHPDEAASLGRPAWVGEHSFLVSSNVGRDMRALVVCDLEDGRSLVLYEAAHDVDVVSSKDGTTVLVTENAGGASKAELFTFNPGEPPSLERRGDIALPGRGVIDGSLLTPPPLLSAFGGHVTYTYTSPLVPGDVWRVEPLGPASRLTTSPGPDAAELVEPSLECVKSFDGEEIPLFLYRRAGEEAGERPVVLLIHGGPESQSMLTFNPVLQAMVDAGFAVLVPNVRGSTGYGKRYAGLDDTTKRLDSVRDLASIHEWLPTAGLDPSRAALYGGSYGGYMVLAGIAFQPELWAAGVDVVGISDLVTFLENTSPYRRAHREREYGSLDKDRSFLEEASPLRRADAIKAPLFVIHGENDPRVPVSEARQLVSSLERRGIAHELCVFSDEGHGLAKLKNRLEAYPKAIAFLRQHVLEGLED